LVVEIDAAAIRADVLEMAFEDCYSFAEFHRSWDEAFAGIDASAAAKAARDVIAVLIEEGLVRVHRGDQCTGYGRASSELDVTPDEFRAIDPAEWGPDGREWLNVCNTERTKDAYHREWRNMTREKSKR
jgi:hypothetical protein